MKNETKTIAEDGEHYSVWLRQEHYTHYKIPKGVASSMSEAIQLVRDCDEKIHDHHSYDCFETWGNSINLDADLSDEIFEAEITKD